VSRRVYYVTVLRQAAKAGTPFGRAWAAAGERSTAAVASLAVFGGVFGGWVLVATASVRHETSTSTLFSGSVGGLYLATGVIAHLRQPTNRVGLLMVLVGVGWFAEDIQISNNPVVHTVGYFVRSVDSGFLVHLVLAFPGGQLRSRADRALTATAYLIVLVAAPVATFFVHTTVPNLVLIANENVLVKPAFGAVQGVLAVAVALVLGNRWRTATPAARRVLAPVYLTGLTGAASSIVHPWLADTWWPNLVLGGIEHTATLLLPVAFLAGVWRVRLGRTAVAELVVGLPGSSPGQLRDLLARALGDPALRVGYHRPDHADYVDQDGLPVRVPPGRELTPVERNGRPVAALVHDPAIREDRHVLAAVIAAAAAELDNQRLAAEVRAQLVEVRASRARIVEAVDEQRRRVERDLHDGAQQQLVTVALTLRLAQQRLTDQERPDERLIELLRRSAVGLEDALAELRELARGIHPAILSEAGLLAALRTLASRSPSPVDLRESPIPALRAPVEATAYFVAAEALTNALKHGRTAAISIEVRHDAEGLHVVVSDDGVGGAEPTTGGGLLGLRDRVSAVDGELTVSSAPGAGTIVHAVLPVDAP
jgi:signal transduction histidine kinase